MARPRIHDEDVVIEKALDVFWEKGFSDTSSRDLIAATGISNGSLFNSFGDKGKLYLACLQKYDVIYVRQLEELLVSGLTLKQKIKQLFESTAKIIPTDGYEGCFLFNSSVDSGIHDEAISTLTATIQLKLEKAFRTAVDQAKERKELPKETNAAQVAQYLVTMTTGLRALVKKNTPPAEMGLIIRTALKFLPF